METTAFYESRAHSWSPNEKDHKLIQLLESQQQRGKSKATLNGVLPQRGHSGPSPMNSPTPSLPSSINLMGPGKVRQMFEERRNNSKGIDKSRPLEPLPRSGGSSPSPALSPTNGGIGYSNIGSSRKTPSPAPLKAVVTTNGHALPPATKKIGGGPPISTSRTSLFDRGGGIGGSLHRPSSLDSLRAESEYDGGPVPSTTKYIDYAAEFEHTVRQKEAELRDKMKGLHTLETAPRAVVPPAGAKVAKAVRPTNLIPDKKPPPKTKQSAPAPAAPVVTPKTPPPGTEPCPICGRCFAIDRLAKHQQICAKTKQRKRKPFDVAAVVRQDLGIDDHSTAPPPRVMPNAPNNTKKNKQLVGGGARAAGGAGGKKSNWRAKHEDFIRTIRAAKEYNAHVAAGGDPNDLPPPPDSDYSDYVDCPHCGRKFAEGAANRHIPMCAGIKSNKF